MASFGQNPTDEELQEIIFLADSDDSGDIDFAEFVALIAHRNQGQTSETLKRQGGLFRLRHVRGRLHQRRGDAARHA